MKPCVIATLLLGLSFVFARPLHAETPASHPIIPSISMYFKTGMAGYRPTACECFDRSIWALDMGLYSRWHRFIGLEAQYRYGTILLGGNFPYSGYGIGLRAALLPDFDTWWDDFYLRIGLSNITVAGTREESYRGVYAYPGWSIVVFSNLSVENEVMLAHYFGGLSHLQVGFRTGLRWSLW